MASVDEIDAGVTAVMPTLYKLVDQLVPDIFGYRQKTKDALAGTGGQGTVHDVVKEALEAAEHVRAGKQPPAPKLIDIIGVN